MSKFLALLLRHRPEEIGLTLEPGGWVRLKALVEKVATRTGASIGTERIRHLIRSQSKPRFALSEDGERIRANYGHSVDVDLELEPTEPPETLYHGTARRAVSSILEKGLRPRSRRFVHLSTDPASARTVGARHGDPVVLRVRARASRRAGSPFYRAAPGIWLTWRVRPEHVHAPEEN